ncbi:PREDICTED: ranBP-type and C3HC4-type zinc finger-containing protein 1 [Nanorana parkeri]|uniref:ranBP-type and C3HC4-type zinc finger-containing protein 1 n=1 Tax=Nanorana parkeri TaxID=125878 RepID=UPI0008544878|nr:PREDICTED: ranBP-type and C3HC4-type zinc finger-containing protein 1 [Nanorana parkeri]
MSGTKPPIPTKPGSPLNVGEPLLPETDPTAPVGSLCTKEELVQRLSRCVESGDQNLAAQYAAELAKSRVPVHIQLKQTCYPRTEICMKVGVEDAKASVNISTYVHSTDPIIFKDYQFHPSIQRWIIGQCLCSDDRTVMSYGITRDGDTAFLYLLGAKQAKLTPQDKNAVHQAPSQLPESGLDEPRKANTLPMLKTAFSRRHNKEVRSSLRKSPDLYFALVCLLFVTINLFFLQPAALVSGQYPCLSVAQKLCKTESMDTTGHPNPIYNAPPSPAQVGWSCPACTFFNVPTRPGCEICCSDRPTDYVVPDWYKPEESERRRMQQENDGLQQYKKAQEEERQQNFLYLLQLDNEVLIPNQEAIECRICYTEVPAGGGVLLRECLHSFCRTMRVSHSGAGRQPKTRLVSQEEYSRILERGLVVAESRSQNSYHCRTADCKGWCIYEDSVNEFFCPICGAENCLTCKAIHNEMNCKEYQDDLRIRALNDTAARQTSDMLKTLVQTGEAMYCPACQIIVQKKDGCDWIRCTMCQTEICWVTKGPRWGPQGPGDTSGGCQCNMNGRKCDPRCQNCH